MDRLVKFLKDEDGAFAIEYALIAALIAVAIITAVGNLGTGLSTFFQDMSDKITGIVVP
jgi:pilus assembly protein Flp/PilA